MSPDEVLNIREGLEVYGTDGEKLGKVARVFPDIPGGGPATEPRTDVADPAVRDRRDPTTPMPGAGLGPAPDLTVEEVPVTDAPRPTSTGSSDGTFGGSAGGGFDPTQAAAARSSSTATQMTADTRYFQLDRGGILGIAAQHLYVPFSDVCDVVPDRCITINCTKDECATRYAEKPEFLDENRPSML